jgi:hypothetical protein
MAQTRDGAIKSAARLLGTTEQQYRRNLDAGNKWCVACKRWHPKESFGRDSSRSDGLAVGCRDGRNIKHRLRYVKRNRPEKGRAFVPARDGDRKQARGRINYFVHAGILDDPDNLPCVDCGHQYAPGGRRHEYDHYLGYAAIHHEDVQAVCSRCHYHRERKRTGKVQNDLTTGRFNGKREALER